MFDDIETHRICSTCDTRIGKRKATAAKGAGAGPSKRPSAAGAGAGPSERQKDKKGGSRARPDNNTKLEILKLLDAKVSQVEIADHFGCSERFIRTVKADRKKVEAATAAGGGTQKTARRGDFPEVSSGEEEDEEKGSGDDNTGAERRAPPAYAELSPHFSVLEAAADESGNGDAAFFLTKAKMVMIAAHSAKRVRQADMRAFVAATE